MLTRLYDPIVQLTTREGTFKQALLTSAVGWALHFQEKTLALLSVMAVVFSAPASAEAKYIFDDTHGVTYERSPGSEGYPM